MIIQSDLKRFNTLFFVKASLIILYLALTFPIPFIAISGLKRLSIIFLILGFCLITNLTNDFVQTSDNNVSYHTSLIANLVGKKSWQLSWEDIKSIKSIGTSQGSKVHYFVTDEGKNFLIPQRINKLEEFILVISTKTNLNTKNISYISPLWTYKLLTFISLSMLLGEISFFAF